MRTEARVLATSSSSCSDGVGEGLGVGVKLTGRLLIYCHVWCGMPTMFLSLYRPIGCGRRCWRRDGS